MATTVSIRSLLDAAVHFGHQTRRWNPKMKPYIFGDRNGIYIIDLKQTLIELDRAYTFVSDLAARGGTLLFVGTKKQAQEAVAKNAERCGMPYVNARWLGGMLTNFVTIRARVSHMEELEAMDSDGRMAALPKKEQILLRKELGKLQTNLNGVRGMKNAPQAIFVIDTKREEIAIHEAQRLGIPVIGVIDTNADPDEVDFGIPANDDAIRSVALLCEVIADAVIAGATSAVISEAEMIDVSARDVSAGSVSIEGEPVGGTLAEGASGATATAPAVKSADDGARAQDFAADKEVPGAQLASGDASVLDRGDAAEPTKTESEPGSESGVGTTVGAEQEAKAE
jgi:small subunit ribosomal protein S2